jgi:hypothetical protein
VRVFWIMGLAVLALPLAAAAQVPKENRLGGVPVPGSEVRALAAARFSQLHAAVAPRGAGERWTEIPWETDLWAARQRAARERKPLLMWIMDGHPLGCT